MCTRAPSRRTVTLQRQQALQPLRRPVGPLLLDEREDGVDDDHREDGHGQLREAGQERQRPGDPEHRSAKKWTSWCTSRRSADGRFGGGSWLGPSATSRAAASADVSPPALAAGTATSSGTSCRCRARLPKVTSSA